MSPIVCVLGTHPWIAAGCGLVVLAGAIALMSRITTLLYTVRALAWMPPLSRRLARWVGSSDYSEAGFLAADGADLGFVARRRRGLNALAAAFRSKHKRSIEWSRELRQGFSDLRFTDANRVPFPFLRSVREKFDLSTVVTASRGPRLQDLDGNWMLDVGGSYGVNVAGYERYKLWIAAARERVKDLGPVLGPLHPMVTDNIARLREISGLDEVSFHASGTEAVMAAVRMARFNTGRKLIACFSGAYHGWWDGVQPGLGNERDIGDCLTLKDLHPASLELLRRRAREIAGVLVNPVQSFHPNSPPPNDAVLLTSEVRKTESSTTPYAAWLRQLRDVCSACEIPLIFDEVFSGFRLGVGGAQECFGVRADIVVYGKTVAGGLPIGVVCGRRALMRRFDANHPMRIAYVIGTFSAHPLVMAAMNEFLRWVASPAAADLYQTAESRCEAWTRSTNAELAAADLPIRVARLSTIWTVLFTEPGRYSWLLQYYLRAQDVALSWVGTGRCLASLDYETRDYDDLRRKLVDAARTMKADGWWPTLAEQPQRPRRMRWNLAKELLGSLVRMPDSVTAFYAEIMRRKHDDHVASHSHILNQIGHLFSSSVFIACYGIALFDLPTAMTLGLAALFVRQFGHAVIEPPCHDKEMKLLGFTTRSKTLVVLGYLAIPILRAVHAGAASVRSLLDLVPVVALNWVLFTAAVIVGHILLVAWQFDLRSSMIWFVKLATDPLTDIVAYSPPTLRAARGLFGRRSEETPA
jgi:glutamate-1-semialdehyde 2,1-aminomutase